MAGSQGDIVTDASLVSVHELVALMAALYPRPLGVEEVLEIAGAGLEDAFLQLTGGDDVEAGELTAVAA